MTLLSKLVHKITTPGALRSVIPLLLLTMVKPSSAQTEEQIYQEYYESWYQIELIVFERIQRAAADPEAWPKTVSLSYPENVQFLFEEGELPEDEQPTPGQIEDPANNSVLLEKLADTESKNDPLNKKIIDSIKQSEIERITPKEKPFILLGSSLRAMNYEARVLSRDPAMRVLFHEIWRQPFSSQEEALPILITGGELFDQNFELEGTITLHLARYLHINTNLWLSQFEANFGQAIEHWPILPMRPEPAKPLTEEEIALELAQSNEQYDIDSSSVGNWRMDLKENTSSLNFNTNEQGSDNLNLFGDYNNLTEKPFLVKQIVAMKQKRRMRSGELHYLDHPRLGVIIRIDQYDPKPPSSEEDSE